MNKYYRCSNSNNPMSDWGHAMFCNNFDWISHYGKNVFVYDGKCAIDINGLTEKIIEAWEDEDKRPIEFETLTSDEVIEAFNPSEIVDSAAAWDSELMMWFWENIAEPNNIVAITTRNGAIVWDAELIQLERVQE